MKKIPVYLRYLFQVWLVALFVLFVFRIVLYFTITNSWQSEEKFISSEVFQSFVMGLRYDNVITAYLLFLPFIVLTISYYLNIKPKLLIKISTYYFVTVFGLSLFIVCADIPFYVNFNSRLTTASLLWVSDFGYMANMILKDWEFLSYLILFLITFGLMIYLFRRLSKKYRLIIENKAQLKPFYTILIVTFTALLLVVSARGRLDPKSPIRIGTAYFSNNQTLNKIALNPIFTFVHSFIKDLKEDNKVNLMNEEKALELSTHYLSLPQSDSTVLNLYNQWGIENFNDSTSKKNVVIVLMESMGTFKMGHFNGVKNLTPNLNKIASKSICFSNFYTSGIHTFNGIYSTLFSYPALYKQQPLEELMNVNHNGIAEILKNNGYSTSYFTTHDPNFDNVSGFLKANSFENIYSDYPSEWIETTNGVPDHRMFEYAIPILTEKASKPSFSVFMTASDHRPFVIPEGIDFEPKSATIETQITEYADWSIGKFLEDASKQDWYSNTIFVFLGDHGQNLGHTYDMPLSYHHSPLLIYAPNQFSVSDTLENLTGQIDVAPSILSLLNIDYKNNTVGIDVFKKERPFMYFCADDKIGCLDKEHYLILRPDGIETLYKYENLSTDNYLDKFKSKVDSMKSYTYSMMQATQSKLKN